MSYNELKQHGTDDFPFQLYKIDENHPKYEMAFHWHASIELIRVLRGELLVTLNKRTHRLAAGDILFVNSETVHGATPHDCVYECLVLNPGFLKNGNRVCDAFLDDLIHHHCALRPLSCGPRVREQTLALFSAMDHEGDGYFFHVIGAAAHWLGAICEEHAYTYEIEKLSESDQKNVQKIKNTLAFIRENFDKEITLDDMAAVAGLSARYFCSFFKEMTLKTPIEYLKTYRIERAARKLLGSDRSVTEIAFSCGFNDLSYFIKTFKQIKNCSPNVYRKLN